jgi:hypothetical protein
MLSQSASAATALPRSHARRSRLRAAESFVTGNQTLEVPRLTRPRHDPPNRPFGNNDGRSQRRDDNATNTASITCRIPADKLDEAIARVRQLGKQEELSITAQDISEEYADLEIEMANQKKLETRLLDLLGRQTNRLSDLLEIERETARVRGTIDQMEGRKRFWDNQLELSTLIVAVTSRGR